MQIAACATTDAIIIKAATPHPTGAPTQVLDIGFVDTLGGGGENAGVLTTITSEGGENTEVVASKGRGEEVISTNVLLKNCTGYRLLKKRLSK